MTDRSPLLDLYELRSGPEPRTRNHVADFMRERGLMGLADRFNDPTSGAGMIADALGDIGGSIGQAVTAPARVMRGDLDPRSNEGIAEALNMAGTAAVGGYMIPKPAGTIGMAGGRTLARGNDTVVMYHGTSADGVRGIRSDGVVRGPAFFSDRKGQAAAYAGRDGDVIAVPVRRGSLMIDADMPGGQLMSVDEANRYFRNDGWTIDDYLRSGRYSFGVNEDVPIGSVNILDRR